MNTAKLKADLDAEIKTDPIFATNWSIVIQWSEDSRYEKHNKDKAEIIYSAITDSSHRVLKWVKLYW